MSRPVVGEYAEELYARLAPLAYDDEDQGWPLLVYCDAFGSVHQLAQDLVTPREGRAGWSDLFDVDRCPAVALPYLAQLPGERIPVGTPEAQARELIRVPAGWRRCSRQAVLNAVEQTLTGTKYVGFIERQDDSFWKWLVTTRPAETPDSDATYRAILSQKRAGVIATHVLTDVTLIDELVDTIDDQTGTIDNL